MKIKMLTGLSGSEYNLTPGDERDFPNEEAKRLIDAGFAVAASGEKRETAVKKPAAETRAKG
ncbi:hypothetical protein [Pseudogemmobacter hezensis]|uniref:hypothetical protein n=1 Tax=Pseudogemmobacter hezensis TaxID=2737662 RepID=UPI001C132787|nr:hypothetical protein [Pseudogemmobacter hezensis]